MEGKVIEVEEYTIALAKHCLTFKLPTTRPVNFETCFARAVTDPESVALISNANACRASMVDRLAMSPVDHRYWVVLSIMNIVADCHA